MHKLKSRIAHLLGQGTKPREIALTVALGLTLGTIPVLGSTTLLCAIAAAALRLNVPLIMLVNYLAYPIQLALYIPLLLMGGNLLDSSIPSLTLEMVYAMLRTDLWGSIERLFWANLGAVLIWGAAAAPAGIGIQYWVHRFLERQFPGGRVSP